MKWLNDTLVEGIKIGEMKIMGEMMEVADKYRDDYINFRKNDEYRMEVLMKIQINKIRNDFIIREKWERGSEKD